MLDDKSFTECEEKNIEADVKAKWLKTLNDLNVCSQKGLVERFDSSIGAGSVYMPYGGKYQLTEVQTMVAKLPVLKGTCDTVTMMSYGFDLSLIMEPIPRCNLCGYRISCQDCCRRR